MHLCTYVTQSSIRLITVLEVLQTVSVMPTGGWPYGSKCVEASPDETGTGLTRKTMNVGLQKVEASSM